MRVCLMIESQEDVSWEDWLALAQACERGGLDALFRSDHYASISAPGERGALDAWTTLAALAARTDRLRLGTLVSPATFRHPSVLAKSAVTVDHVSGGRVEVGLGAGWYEREHREYGFPFGERRERLEAFAEQLEIVHRQWTEETVTFAGRHYRLEECRALPRPVQDPHPPLIVGGAAGRGTVEPAVRFADEYNTVYASPEACRERRARLDDACERAGRDPATLGFSLMTRCAVASDRREVVERTRRMLAQERRDDDPEAFARARPDGSLVGTVEEVVEQLREVEAAGVERVMLQHLVHDDVEMVELLGAEVRPAVA